MSQAASRTDVIRRLRQRLLTAQQTPVTGPVVSSGLPQLDRLLPHGGLRPGSVVECVSTVPGLSAATLSLQCIRQLLQNPGAFAVIDSDHEFNSAAAAAVGIATERLLLIRPPRSESLPTPSARPRQSTPSACPRQLWSLEQTARCPGVRAVLCRLDRASSTVLRRLQLAVEASGVTVFLLRPASCLKLTSWADLRLQLDPEISPRHPATCLTVRVTHSRHAVEHHGIVRLKVHHETGVVSEVPQLADPATASFGIR